MSSRAATLPTLVGLLALAAAPTVLAGAAEGEPVYQKYCSQCHGVEGEADGAAAPFVLPRPRVLADNSTYKFRSTPSGELPTDADLFRVIWDGLPGTSMPRFSGALTEREAWDLVALLKSYSEDFVDPDLTVTALPMPELADPRPIPPSPASLARGKEVYDEVKCWQCHGAEGRGDGASWLDLKDEWGNIILPANLAIPDHYRGGDTPIDVFRTISTGLNGTPMPAYSDSTTVEDRWHLVNYVLSLGPAPGDRRHDTIVALPTEEIPGAFDEEAWAAFPQARFELGSNVIEPPRLYWPAVEFAMVRAAYTKREIALRIQWDDRSQSEGNDAEGTYEDRDGSIHHLTDHPDQFAVMFPADDKGDGKRPYIMFGDSKRPVTLWWWRSDAGAVQEINAKGWGTFQDQPGDPEVVSELQWQDGRYTLLVRRTLQSIGQGKDVTFRPGEFTAILLNAWDGARGEVGQRRALTTWSWLYLRPKVPRAQLGVRAAGIGFGTFLLLAGLVGWTRFRKPEPATARRAA